MNTPERSKVGTPSKKRGRGEKREDVREVWWDSEMNTPERSKVEDSPVFNFMNSLSPIQPVKSKHSAHAYHTLRFTSISSVFTSPHANLQKEARFPTWDSVSDLPKHEISSDNEGGNNPCAGASNVAKPSLSARTCSLSEAAVDGLKMTESDASIIPYICEAKNVPCIEQSEGETGPRSQVFSENCENQALTSGRIQEMGHGSTSGISIACKVESQQRCGMRRRCLNFEGVSEMALQNDSTACYSNGAHPSSNILPVSFKVGNPLTCIVPGIGLHLNSLGSKDRFLSRETLVSRQRLSSMPSPIGPFHSTTGHESHDKPLSLDKGLVAGIGIYNPQIMHDDVSQSSALISGKDLHSPKKKRRKLEIGAESREGCKRCNCNKSKCLKLYCECFAAGVFCAEPCSCQSCFNKPIHQETVLNTRKQIESRNPLAFAPKVIRPSDPDHEIGEEVNKTPASARHKRGCNCKKSSCLKKYCECYQGGVGCSVSCRCEGCKNAFGRKDD